MEVDNVMVSDNVSSGVSVGGRLSVIVGLMLIVHVEEEEIVEEVLILTVGVSVTVVDLDKVWV
jgi:hypothetical protein